MIYLDTHVVVWLYEGDLKKFPKKTIALLENEPLFISPAVKLELQFLYEIKRLKEKPEKILNYLGHKIGLVTCALAFLPVIDRACEITWTRDPFDRLIIAQATHQNAPLITKDKTLLRKSKLAIWN
jgi:PIN domain nuclease of toxin-antitoxin system